MTPLDPTEHEQEGPTVADVMMASLDRIERKADDLLKSDGEKTQSLTDINSRLTKVESLVNEHEALKNKGAGIMVVCSAIVAFMGVVFWKAVDYLSASHSGGPS